MSHYPVEREQPWYEQLTDEEYQFYYNKMWSRAYLALGSENEADAVIDQVIDEVWQYKEPPSKAMIVSVLHQRTTWRIRDRLRSPRHLFLRMRCQSLTLRTHDGEEFEMDVRSDGYPGADEELFRWQKDEATAQQIAQAVISLNERQRTCFFLRFMENMETKEIAKILMMSAATVSTECYRARNKVRKHLKEWTQKQY
jgi:RNA polymerase sigma factor (sigma-70 family)